MLVHGMGLTIAAFIDSLLFGTIAMAQKTMRRYFQPS